MNRIEFIPASKEVEDLVCSPQPSSKFIPEWYKKIKPNNAKNIKWSEEEVKPILNLKNCVPFLDAMTSGYTMTTWCDLHIEKEGDNVRYRYASAPTLLETRQSTNLEVNSSFYPIEFIWKSYWRAKLPSGYSLLITHPMNRLDLPFQTLSAIIDSDHFYHRAVGNIPFYIKKDFEGLIPCGTPMFHLFPFRRNNWQKHEIPFDETKRSKLDFLMNRLFIDSYKRQFWQKKSFT